MMVHLKQARPEATDEDIRASIAISREHHETALEILKVYNGIERAIIQDVLENVVSKMEADALGAEIDEEETPSRPPLIEYPEEALAVSGFAGERLGYPEGPRLVDSKPIDPKDRTSWN